MSQVCRTIIEQLGGNQTGYMLNGVYSFSDRNNRVTLKIKARGAKVNCITVEYNAGQDLYTFKACKLIKFEQRGAVTLDMIYGDQLRGLVEKYTGLRTSMTAVYS